MIFKKDLNNNKVKLINKTNQKIVKNITISKKT